MHKQPRLSWRSSCSQSSLIIRSCIFQNEFKLIDSCEKICFLMSCLHWLMVTMKIYIYKISIHLYFRYTYSGTSEPLNITSSQRTIPNFPSRPRIILNIKYHIRIRYTTLCYTYRRGMRRTRKLLGSNSIPYMYEKSIKKQISIIRQADYINIFKTLIFFLGFFISKQKFFNL